MCTNISVRTRMSLQKRILFWSILLLCAISIIAEQQTVAQPFQAPPVPNRNIPVENNWGGTAVQSMVSQMPLVTLEEPKASSEPFDGAARLASQSLPQYLSEPVTSGEEYLPKTFSELAEEGPTLPPGARAGFFQKLGFTGTWISQPGGDDLGYTDLDAWIVLALPFPTVDAPLLITPSFGVHYLDGPSSPVLPTKLYDASIEWRHLRRLNNRWAMDIAVTTGYYSDFEQSSSDAFRISGRGLAIYEWSPTTKVIFGVAYLNRAGASVVPVGGLLVTPHDGLRLELIIPRPKIAWRINQFSIPGEDERWCYIGAEFGGGVWSYERSPGVLDLLQSSDYRILFGTERKIPGWFASRFEAGYIFGREIEFRSATPNYEPGDTFFLRAGLTY